MVSKWVARFWVKALLAALLVALGDMLFYQGNGLGSNVGGFAAAWALATALTLPAIWRDWRALIALVAAFGFAAILSYDPGLLAWIFFWAALAVAALLPRVAPFGDAWRWLLRLMLHAVSSVAGPWRDLFRDKRSKRRSVRSDWRAILPLLPLPLIGGAIFVALFASANPIIGDLFGVFTWPDIDDWIVLRAVLWGMMLTTVWATLRPRRVHFSTVGKAGELPMRLAGVSIGSVTLSLIVFNALFAVQNALDIAYLWRGAALPAGTTLAGYAHRGAYPLIATALLAGLFVLVTLRPGSDTAAVPTIRRMVVLWVVQNIFLVASTMLRTIDYIEVYSLTQWRIAALVWMALVAIGLALICARLLLGRGDAWLINANTIAAGVALTGCQIVDLGSVAAAWNVRHARDVGGQGAKIDLCYLSGLGPSALVSLVELQQRLHPGTVLADRVAAVRSAITATLDENQQAGWWTWRNADRLARVASMPPGPLALAAPNGRECDGAISPPPVTVSVPDPAPNSAPSLDGDPPLTRAPGQ